ncbi:MAG: glycosyltransferase family 2 protein [Pyrinomonadaceae bacterium]
MIKFAYIFFVGSIIFLAYTYAGYPLFVYLYGKFFPKTIKRKEFVPLVTILITAYNEEGSIAEKIENTLELDYPKEKLEILVASDGSDDNTDEIVRGFASRGVKLFHQTGRKGKTHTQNNAVELATGEIIIFSDATTTYSKDVVQKLIPAFADDAVGCVAGRLIYRADGDSSVGKGAATYWEYETLIKQAESNACSLIGVSGCMYAVRKGAYIRLYDEACSDFIICTELYRNGFRSVFEPSAVCYEITNNHSKNEFQMRVRVIVQTFTDLFNNADMLNPLKSGFYSVELISHKLFRYMVPFALILFCFANLILIGTSEFFLVTILLQVVFYFMALVGWVLERAGIHISLLSLPFYFVIGALASILGFFKFLTGARYASWEPIRESSSKTESEV